MAAGSSAFISRATRLIAWDWMRLQHVYTPSGISSAATGAASGSITATNTSGYLTQVNPAASNTMLSPLQHGSAVERGGGEMGHGAARIAALQRLLRH